MNQANAARVLRSLRAENTELASHLQALRDENPAVRNLDLSSYLLVPSTFAAVFLVMEAHSCSATRHPIPASDQTGESLLRRIGHLVTK